MSGREEWGDLLRAGGQARVRLREAWGRLETESGRLASDADAAARKTASALKWGAGSFLLSAVLFRLVKFRRGFRGLRWLWSLGPVVARFTLSRILGRSR